MHPFKKMILSLSYASAEGTPPTAPAYYVTYVSNSTPISNCAGAGVSTYPIQVSIERSPIIVGDIIYQGSGLSTVFIGDSTWYSTSSTFSMRIDSIGTVLQIDNSCAPLE